VGAETWFFLAGIVVSLLLIDLLVIHRKASVMSTRRAAVESAVWISVGLLFSLYVLAAFGASSSGEYLSAYLIEKSLSIDNVFVWSVILTHYRVPEQFQHRVLFWCFSVRSWCTPELNSSRVIAILTPRKAGRWLYSIALCQAPMNSMVKNSSQCVMVAV
jgi:hypothetical protein